MKHPLPILLLTMLLFILAACSPAQPNAPANPTTPDLSKTDNQGAVTVDVTPLNLDKPGDTLEFDIAMSTHSVELDMDLATLATLTTDTGLAIQPAKWDAPRGGHHVNGTLSFPTSQDGKSVLDGAKQLTLTIIGIDNATRTFTWDLNVR